MITNFIKELWLGKISLGKTFLFTIIPLSIYAYLIHFVDLGIVELSLFILLDMLGLIFSFFILACIWRSSSNNNSKFFIIFSRAFSIFFIIYFLYMAYFKWVI